MRTISADEFVEAVRNDPSWASKLTEPTAVTGYLKLEGSPITHLSPLLHFTETGVTAEFVLCKQLKVAEGNFAGYVGFDFCGITKIGELNITGTHPDGDCASFAHCYQLKIAEGNFPGKVVFSKSGVTEIGDLTARANKKGEAADFKKTQVQIARGTFYGGVDFSDSDLCKIDVEKLIIKDQVIPPRCLFTNCANLHIAQGNFPGPVIFHGSAIKEIRNLSVGKPGEDNISALFWDCNQLRVCPKKILDDDRVIIPPGVRTQLRARHQALDAVKNRTESEIEI